MATIEGRVHNPLARMWQKANDAKRDFLYGKPYKPPSEPTAPHTLVTEIKSSGLASPEQIQKIIYAGFPDVGFYLTLKGLDANPQKQKEVLEQYVDINSAFPHDSAKAASFARNAISFLDADSKIEASKFNLVHAQGNNLWQERFHTIIDSLQNNYPEATLVLNAYAGLIGLRQALTTYHGPEMLILVPPWIRNETTEYSGYRIALHNTQGQRVSFLSRDFQRPEAIFVDDVKRSGAHVHEMKQFWSNGSLAYFDDKRIGTVLTAPASQRI